MEDPDDDWDVEAELQRQLDALELSEEEDERLSSGKAPEKSISKSHSVNGVQNGLQEVPEKQSGGGQQPWVHLEAMLREREEKLNAFDSSLRALLGSAEAGHQVAKESDVPAGSSLARGAEDQEQCTEKARKNRVQTAEGAKEVENNRVSFSNVENGTASGSLGSDYNLYNAAGTSVSEDTTVPRIARGVPAESAALEQATEPVCLESTISGQLRVSEAQPLSDAGTANHIQGEACKQTALEGASGNIFEVEPCIEITGKDLRSEILDLEYQVHLDALQHRHETTTSEIEQAKKEELARQAEEENRAQARRAASEAAGKKREEERRRAQEERESRMKAIQSQLELAARQAFAASRIVRAYRRHVQSVRQKAAVRLQAAVRAFLCRKNYTRFCTEHLKSLIQRCEAQNDIKGLEAAAERARNFGLEEQARAAAERTRARVHEAREAIRRAAESGSLQEVERARNWATSAGVDQSEIVSAEAVFARRVEAQLAFIETGVCQGLPFVSLLAMMKEAQLLGVNRGRLDQAERDVRARDRSAVQELQEAAQSGSIKGSGGFEEALRKARQSGLLEEIAEAEEMVNARRESALEGLTRVLELGLGGQSDLTRLVNEAVRLDMQDAAKAAETRWENQVKEKVCEITEAARSGSRSQFAGLVRTLRNRGRKDGLDAAKALLEERLTITREGLAQAAKQGSREEIENWVKKAEELDLIGEIRDAKKEHARRIRSTLESFKAVAKRLALDTSIQLRGGLAVELEAVSSAALTLGVSKSSLGELKAAIETQMQVESCKQSGGFGGIYSRNDQGHPVSSTTDQSHQQDVTFASEESSGDIIVDALQLGSSGQHQFLANATVHFKRSPLQEADKRDAESRKDARFEVVVQSRASKDATVSNEAKGIPIWPYRMDWAEIGRLRSCWQQSVAVDSDNAKHEEQKTAERKEDESEASSEEESVQNGLRSRKSQVALESETDRERLLSNQEASTSGEKGPLLSKTLLENAAGGLTVLEGLDTLDLALEGLRGLGPKSLLAKLCPKLKSIRLDVNRLTTLEGGFDGLGSSLETLSVRDNHLTSLRGLEGLSRLQVLRLDANLIKKVEFGSANKGLLWPSLTELGLSANRITRVRGLGEVCANLEVLEMAGNALQRFEGVLRGFPRLRVLDVSRNRLKARALWPELRHCPLLTTLVASSNKLCELPSNKLLLSGHVLLRELWLNGNGIRKLVALCWLPNLQRLYLQDNAIEMIAPLWGCLNLEVLDLSFNCISNPDDFRHLGCLRSLRSLQLNDNPVASTGHSYATAVLSAVPWLRELDNEPVTDTLRESVLKSLIEGRAGLLVGIMNKLQVTEAFNQKSSAGRVIPIAAIDLEGGVDLPGDSTPQNAGKRVSILWETVLRAVGIGEAQGLLPRQEASVRDAGIRHQKLCASWRAQLARSARDLSSGGTEKGGISDPQNEKAPSLLVQQLGQCFQEHVRFDQLFAVEIRSNGLSSTVEIERNGSDAKRNEEYYAAEKQKRSQVVTCIQASWRGARARTRFSLLMKERAQTRRKAAVKIQALWRGYVARSEKSHVAEREAAARKVQARWRGHFMRRKIERAMQAAKYVDEDDFEFEDEGLLAGLENGLSRPSTVKKDNWVGVAVDLKEIKRTPEQESTDFQCTPKQKVTDFPKVKRTQEQKETDFPTAIKASANRMETERKPLEPIYTPALSAGVNGAPSSVVPLPTISPPRSKSHVENHRQSHVVLPEIRLASSQADPPLRTSKRFSEPIGGNSLEAFLGGASNEATPRQLGDEASIQSTPRGPHVPRSLKKMERQRQSITEIAQEWGFKDEGTAAAAFRSREKLLRNKKLENQQKSLQDPDKRLQAFKAQAKRGPRLLPRPSLPKIRPAWAGVSGAEEDSSSDG